MLERAGCPLCEETARNPTPYRDERGYAVVRCPACHLYYLSPRLSEEAMLERYRDESYFEGGESGYDAYRLQERSLRQTFARLLRALEKRGLTGGRLLDVGCGFGFLLAAAADHFERCVGTDMSGGAVEVARGFADAVYVGGVDAVPPAERFDIVCALHVLEHVYDPRTFLEELAERLEPGGSLVIAVPDMGSFWRRLWGRRWPSFKYPEHVVFYDASTLRRLLESIPSIGAVRRIPYPHAFPLSEIAGKLGFRVPSWIGERSVWLPATTVAFTATRLS